MRRQGTAIARLRLVEPLAAIATQRVVAGGTPGEQQSFDPVDVLDPLDCQRLALTAKTAAVLRTGPPMATHGHLWPPMATSLFENALVKTSTRGTAQGLPAAFPGRLNRN